MEQWCLTTGLHTGHPARQYTAHWPPATLDSVSKEKDHDHTFAMENRKELLNVLDSNTFLY